MRIREMLRLRRVQAGRLLNDLGDFLGRRSAFREANALCILQSFQIGPGRVKIAIGRGRTSRPENDIRPNQTREEHHFRREKEPDRDLAGGQHRVLGSSPARRRGLG